MEFDFDVVKRYLEGKGSKGDRDRLIEWFSDTQYEKDIRRRFRRIWDELAGREDLEDCDRPAIMGKIYYKLKNDEFRMSSWRRGGVPVMKALQKAAAVLFIPVVTYLLLTGGGGFTSSAEPAYSEIYSPLGTRTRFFLQDGSTGWLNGGSTLKFPTEFMGKYREVGLEGEAYFEVVTDAKRPFVVKGSHIRVVARGTSFNVQAYPEDPEKRVTLVSGRLSLFASIHGKTLDLADLHPDQMCVYNPDHRTYRIENVDAERLTAWKEGKLVFRDDDLASIVKRINRWYNVEIMIMDEALKSYTYQATFVDETLDEVLKLLQHSAPIEYREHAREKRANGTFERRKIELRYKP